MTGPRTAGSIFYFRECFAFKPFCLFCCLEWNVNHYFSAQEPVRFAVVMEQSCAAFSAPTWYYTEVPKVFGSR